MKITPELIPHTEFHTGCWLQNAHKPGWYYFMKKKNPNVIINDSFMESVDEPLRELVTFLHSRNIKTTPSCSGHYFSERHLSEIYDSLEDDGAHIKHEGLEFSDIESLRRYYYRNSNYTLPWNKTDFLSQLETYQCKGVLGMKLGKYKKVRQELLGLQIDGVTIGEKDTVLYILTDQPGADNIKWKTVTREVKNILQLCS